MSADPVGGPVAGAAVTDAAPDAARVHWLMLGPPVRGRSCGSCTACCTRLPVELPSGPKPANTRCQHLCSKGCRIYAGRPDPCRYWSCRWLFDPDTAGLRRPDHAGYVIDSVPDTLLANGEPVGVVQVWCAPSRPDAHRDPALRAYLALVARRTGMTAMVRWNSQDAILLVPPAWSGTGDWLELGSDTSLEPGAMRDRLAAAGAAHVMQRGMEG